MNLCPVCWRPVTRTPHHRICGHHDKQRNICPASYEPHHITIREYFYLETTSA